MLSKKFKSRGQGLVEFVISLIIIPIFFVGIVHLTQLIMVRIRLVQAARHGVWLVSTGRVSEATARQEVVNFLTTGFPRLNPSNIRSINFTMRSGPYALDTVEIQYELRTLQFTENFFHPITIANYRITESATVAHASTLTTPYLPPY